MLSASHLVSIVADEWAAWRWFVLRGAGFPAAVVSDLAEPECSAAAHKLIEAETVLASAFNSTISAFENEVERMSRGGEVLVQLRQSPVVKALRRLRQRKLPASEGLDPRLLDLLESLSQKMEAQQRSQSEFETVFGGSVQRQNAKLVAIANDPKFQEAVIWQNRQAFENGIALIAKERPVRNKGQREHEELVANYIQRYCVKNDSVGFFGPIAWSRIEEGDLVSLRPGPSLLRRRRTYFEDWALDKVAASISQTPGMDWWAVPRLSPLARVELGKLHLAGSASLDLPSLAAEVLQRSNGQHLPDDILQTVRRQPAFQNVTREDVTAVLKDAAARGLLFWRFAVPVGPDPERSLRRQLSQIGDPQLKQTALEKLNRLETAREDVARSAENPALLNQSLQKLETLFEEMTQAAARRNAGMTYGGRSLVYEDCQRDISFIFSPELLKPITPAFSLLLKSARWLMQSTASAFLSIFQEVYASLASQTDNEEVDVATWWAATLPLITDPPEVSAIESQFKRQWLEMLPTPEGERIVRFESHKLQQRVEESFPELPGYHVVRYYCPDLLLGATSPEALERSEVQYVLGEIHSAKNTLLHTALTQQHPNPQELQQAIAWDISAQRFKLVNTRERDPNPTRTSENIFNPDDFFLASSLDGIPPEEFCAYPISELVVRSQGTGLIVATRDGEKTFHILDAFADLLFSFMMNKASWSRPGSYVPRIMIDDLIIHRETWRAPVEELSFAMEKEESARFLGARRWLQQRGMPDTLFVKTPAEMKPFYVDMRSPVLVEVLCKMVRRLAASPMAGGSFTFSEMLPDFNGAWLRDAEDRRYTSELRIAFVDLRAVSTQQSALSTPPS